MTCANEKIVLFTAARLVRDSCLMNHQRHQMRGSICLKLGRSCALSMNSTHVRPFTVTPVHRSQAGPQDLHVYTDLDRHWNKCMQKMSQLLSSMEGA